ncbi:Gamma-tubulin complex component 3 [Chytriomyces hyalinus]|nr:Gamma-tubulin complex component 3 [Chytriomyces hyalinus]
MLGPQSQPSAKHQMDQAQPAKTDANKLDKSAAIHNAVARLVSIFARPNPADPNKTSENTEEVTAFCMRILSSRIAPTAATDNNHVVDTIKKRLTRRDKSLKDALAFTSLCFTIDNSVTTFTIPYDNILTRKWAIMHFLHTVSLQTDLLDRRENPLDDAFAVNGLKSVRVAPEFPKLPQVFPDATVPLEDTDAADPIPKYSNKPRGPCNGYYLIANTKYPSTDVEKLLHPSESELLRDIMYIFQDIDGQYIKFNPTLDIFVLSDKVWVPPTTCENLRLLSEVGWLYRKVKSVVSSWSANSSASAEAEPRGRFNAFAPSSATAATTHTMEEGLIRQGFCAGIQKELVKHFELIAQLENQFTKSMEPVGSEQTVPASPSMEFSAKGLSLKRLLVWIHEPLQKLRLIQVLVDSSAGLRGGALLSMVHGYMNHGDPFVQDLVEGLLKQISAPFFQMLKRWIYEGELNDPFQEFFVVEDANVEEEAMWRSRYTLKNEMIPSFLGRSVAKKCYLIGKSLNFIRFCCAEEAFVIQRSQELATSPPGLLEYGDMAALEKSVTSAYTSISAHILSLLFGKYKLMTHLQALKKYLLLGQGDLVQNLMDKLGADLSKPANSIMRHNLAGILESSIRASNAQHDDPDVLRRLDVRLLEVSPGDSGWDVFTLDYRTDNPISTVFPTQSMHQYMKLFTFLWRLKRVEHSLSVSWRKGMTEYTSIRNMADMRHYFHTSSIVLSEMIHFTYQLQYYILFEVLECSWTELNSYLVKRTGDLDQLIGAHNKYLNNITSRGLLAATASNNQNLFSMLIGLFDVILKFQTSLSYLVELAEERLMESKQRTSRDYENQFLKRISSLEDPRLNAKEPTNETLKDRISAEGANMDEIAKTYRADLQVILEALTSHADINLHGLRVRLDYNAFYKK